jgi:hypothetical protein
MPIPIQLKQQCLPRKVTVLQAISIDRQKSQLKKEQTFAAVVDL